MFILKIILSLTKIKTNIKLTNIISKIVFIIKLLKLFFELLLNLKKTKKEDVIFVLRIFYYFIKFLQMKLL